jgi:hypothetical protein
MIEQVYPAELTELGQGPPRQEETVRGTRHLGLDEL